MPTVKESKRGLLKINKPRKTDQSPIWVQVKPVMYGNQIGMRGGKVLSSQKQKELRQYNFNETQSQNNHHQEKVNRFLNKFVTKIEDPAKDEQK